MSKAGLLDLIQKIHLEKGDIIVCRDETALKMFGEIQVPGVDFPVPLVFAPQGVQILKREDLLNLLEQLEQTHSEVPTEQPNAPL